MTCAARGQECRWASNHAAPSATTTTSDVRPKKRAKVFHEAHSEHEQPDAPQAVSGLPNTPEDCLEGSAAVHQAAQSKNGDATPDLDSERELRELLLSGLAKIRELSTKLDTANAAGAAIREKLRAIRSGPSRPAIHPDAATAIEQACAAYFAQQEIALEGMEDPESEFEAPAEEDEEDGQVS